MRFTLRRAAMLAASIALNAFFMLSPQATASLSAARCQQECDAEYGFDCRMNCDNTFSDPSDQQACKDQCNSYWTSCSMHSVMCSPPPADCMQGMFVAVTYDQQCQSTYGSVWTCVYSIEYGWGPC